MSEEHATSSTSVSAEVPVRAGERAGTELQAFFESLIREQCALVGGEGGLVVIVGSSSRTGGVGAAYSAPDGRLGPMLPSSPLVKRLIRLGEESARGACDRSETFTVDDNAGIYDADTTHVALATPLRAADQVHGASVIVAPRHTDAGDALRFLALATARYEAFIWHQHTIAETHAKTRLRETLELLDAAQQGSDARTMGALFCHELARRFGCTRVSIGLISGGPIKLAAVSGTDDLKTHGEAAEAIESAMEECAMQDIEVLYPPTPELAGDPAQQRVTNAHETLSRRFGPAAIVSLPLRVEGDLIGGVTLEREAGDPFPSASIPLLRLVSEFIGPAIWTRRLADRGVLAVTRDRVREIAATAVGPTHTPLKAVLALMLIVFLGAAIIPIPGRVTADGEIEALSYKFVPAPYTGYVTNVLVRPGDRVVSGDVLATMDTADIRLELARATSQRESLRMQAEEEIALGATGEAAVTTKRIDEIDAQVALLERRAARAEIRSPIDGTVSRGDLEALTGAQVDPETPLFEIVSLDEPIVVLKIDERDVARVQRLIAQRDESGDRPDGWFSVSARPGTRIPLAFRGEIRPTATAVAGGNVYQLEATMVDPPPDMVVLPGLTGTARLRSGTTTVLATVSRPLIEAIRLRMWW